MAINYTNGPQIPLDKPFSRFNGTPLDPDQICDTYDNAVDYAKGTKAYIGQRLYVMKPSDKKGSYVIIDTEGTLKKLLDEDDKNSINNGDSTTTVTTIDNKILDYIKYEINNNEVTITECDTSISGVHIIPDIIEGYPVTSIGDIAFNDCASLTSITIPNSVTIIGDYAFQGCTSLTNITIPNSVTSIGDCAFGNCYALESITIPNSVTSIGDYVFYGCYNFTNIIIPDSVTSIGHQAFCDCEGLTNVTIPNSVTSIGTTAFKNCTSLTSITIPNSVTSIGSAVFEDCTALTDIYYEGSEEEWDNIEIDANNEPLLNATIHYNQKLVTKEETMYDISPWQPDTKYEVGDVVIATLRDSNLGDPLYSFPDRTVIAKCVREHTSDDTYFALNNYENGLNVTDAWEILQETYAYYDALGRRIHNTYVTKDEVAGKQTDEDGEIFNDYENNKARTPMSSARGESTVAGGNGFPILKLQGTSNLLNNNDYTLSFNKESQASYIAATTKNFTIYLYPSTYKIGLRTPLVNVADNYYIKVTKTYYNTEAQRNVTESVIDTQVFSELQFVEINEDVFDLFTTDSLIKFDIEMKLKAVHDANREPYKDYICLYDTATTEDPNDSTYTNFCTTPPTGRYYLAEESDMSSFKVNDEISVRIKSNYDNLGKVTNIVSDTGTRYIEVSNFTTGTATTLTNAYLWLPVMPEDWSTYDDPDTKTSLKATRKIDAGTTYMDAAQYTEGSETYAINYAAHAEGNRSVAAGRWSHAEGNGTYAAYGAHSEGLGTKAIGQGSHSEGNKTVSQGYYSHSEGCITNALGGSSHSEGYETTAEGDFSHAEGLNTDATGKGSHAEGYATTASGENSHSEGNQTESSGKYSHAEGLKTIASGDYSHSMGTNTTAEKSGAFAGGTGSHALGSNSFAFGSGAYARNDGAIAIGYGAQAQNYMNVAIGNYALATKGGRTFALGEYVKTNANNQFVIGKGNDLSVKSGEKNNIYPLFIAAYSDKYKETTDTIPQEDKIYFTQSGTNYIVANVTEFNASKTYYELDTFNTFVSFRNGVARVGADPIDNMDVATKRYVDNKMRFMTQSEFDDIDASTLTAGTVVFITE